MYESTIFLHELFQHKSQELVKRQEQGTQFLLREDHTVLGTLTSFLYLCGHTTEYLLKIRIQLETKSFPKTHNLYDLFNQLNKETKEHFESRYEETKEGVGIKNSIKSLFKSHSEYHIDWRYVGDIDQQNKLNAPISNLKQVLQILYNDTATVLKLTF